MWTLISWVVVIGCKPYAVFQTSRHYSLTFSRQTVIEAFQNCGYLRGDADFSHGLEGGTPLSNLLVCQWDRRFDEGYPTTIAPGLFLEDRPASNLDTTQIATLIGISSISAILRLASVLDCRVEDGDLLLKTACWQSLTPVERVELLKDLAITANLEGFEGMAAEDLARAPSIIYTLLESFLRQRDPLAALVLREAYLKSSDLTKLAETERDCFVHMLTVVCSMAAAGDSPSDTSIAVT
jgi:hypothetical protein